MLLRALTQAAVPRASILSYLDGEA
jgi:hypothetical protein